MGAMRSQPRPSLSAALLLVVLGLGAACAHRVEIHSEPPGATIKVGRKVVGPAPQQVRFLWWPGRPMRVRVEKRGYRPLVIEASDTVHLRNFIGEFFTFRYKRLVGLTPRATVEVLLVREHGPAGTWTPDDVKP